MFTINRIISLTVLIFTAVLLTATYLYFYKIIDLNSGCEVEILYSYSSVVFSCFAGVAFLLIWHHTVRKVHKDPDIKDYIKSDRKEWAMWFLSMAFFCWGLSGVFSFLDFQFFGCNENSIRWTRVINECLSTLNSAFLLTSLQRFRINEKNKHYKLYKEYLQPFFTSNKFIWGGFFVVVSLILIISCFWVKNDILFELPDFGYSFITISLLLIHLFWAFEDRGISKMNYLVGFTLLLTFLAQIQVFNISIFSFLNDGILGYVVLFSFKIFLGLLFFILVYTYVHLLKEKASDVKWEKQKQLRQKMNHAIKGSLRNMSLYLDKKNVENLNKQDLMLELKTKIVALANIHETIQNLERSDSDSKELNRIAVEISLKDTIDLLITSLRKLFGYNDENFILDWSLSKDDDLPPSVCRDIVNIVWELTINAERAIRRNGKLPHIKICFEANADWLTISVIDNGTGIDLDTFSKDTFNFGLAYIATIAESFEGKLGWENNEYGGTTMFTKLNVNNVKPSLYANSNN